MGNHGQVALILLQNFHCLVVQIPQLVPDQLQALRVEVGVEGDGVGGELGILSVDDLHFL